MFFMIVDPIAKLIGEWSQQIDNIYSIILKVAIVIIMGAIPMYP